MLVWVAIPVAQVGLVVTSKPEWGGFNPNSWWPALLATRTNYRFVSDLILGLDVFTAVLFGACLAIRVKAMIGLDRLIIAPIYVAWCAFGFSASSQSGSSLIANPVTGIGYALSTLAFISAPLGLITSIAIRRFENATMSEVLHQLFATSQPDVESIERALRKTLRDSSLRLHIIRPGNEMEIIERNRLVRQIYAPDGTTVAILEANLALEHHPGLVSTATHASSVALQNLQLQTDLQAQIVTIEESRTRIALSALEERRRIERDLHDGIQQRLLAVVARLGIAQRDDKPIQRADIELVREELVATLEDLRNLARGIHPQELRQFGFKSALDVIIERLPLSIATNVCDFKASPNLDATLYFVTCELLSNVVKHSDATEVQIDLVNLGDDLVLQVSDNGTGKRDLKYGNGLLGCDDRVKTLGGELSVAHDEPGLSVQVRLPICA